MREDRRTWLRRLLTEGESETLEFKESMDDEAAETIAAFANAAGGTLLIGVADDGSVRGTMLGKETVREWTNRIAQAAHVHPQISRLSYEGKTVVAVHVPGSSVKPIPCRGRYFKRVGKSNRQMSDDDLTRAVLEKVGMTWDQVAEPRATMKDLDPEQLRRFRTLCNEKKRRLIPSNENDRRALEKLGLLQSGRLLRAAVLLFGKDPQRFYLSAAVKIGRFRSATLIVDDRLIGGTLFDQVEGAMQYFRERLQTRFEFVGEPARKVIWEYPLEALREAITNAVCHRDYLDTGHIQVRWHDDSLVFFNPGILPPPLSVEQLRLPHPSKPRNHKVAEMFYYAGLIEQWGSGIQKIFNECSAAGLPPPRFEERTGGLWLTFRKDMLTDEYLRSLGLNDRQVKAVLHVKAKGRIANREYQQLNSVAKPSATRDLTDLVTRGVFKMVGRGRRDLHYVLREPNVSQT
ncbi:MAG: transcriptional regulator [Planctomycetes bacterium]|nr:transcriptional regulator [Planctomycetota bacterium]